MGGDGDLTLREREIREALYSVFYGSEWHLEFRRPEPQQDPDDPRWKYVDEVLNTLRARKAEEPK